MNYFDMKNVKIKYLMRVVIGMRGIFDDIEEDVTCICRGHIMPSEVARYAIRKLAKKHKVSDFMRMDSVAEVISSEVISSEVISSEVI